MDYNERAAAIIESSNVVGLISKSYGTAGQVVVRVWDNFPQNILDGDFAEPLWVEIDSIATPLFVVSLDRQGNSKAAVVFEDFSTEVATSMLIGGKLYAQFADEVIVEKSVDWSFVEGFSFSDMTTGRCGRVLSFIENSMNPLINVDFEEIGEVLVPMAEPLIEKVSKRSAILTMRLPAGFFS